MKTYNTYQEAKIANPECEVAVVARTDEFAPSLGDFISVLRADELLDGYSFADKSKPGCPNISDGYYKICDPSDHCMTVEEFLSVGHKFEAGDLWIDYDGGFMTVGEPGVNHMNKPHERDFERYIIRAAALEKPKRAKIDFVKVEDSIWHLETDFKCGELFAFDGERAYVQVETEVDFTLSHSSENLYRRIETEINWQDEIEEKYDAVKMPRGAGSDLYLGSRWGESAFVEFCVDVAKANGFKLVN